MLFNLAVPEVKMWKLLLWKVRLPISVHKINGLMWSVDAFR